MTPCDIALSGIKHRYRSGRRYTQTLAGIDLCVAEGELVSIVGPSGCGKSTLLKIVLGLETDFEGAATINPVRAKAGVGYIPQSANLLPWRTALQNAALGIELRDKKVSRASRENLLSEFRKYGLGGVEQKRWGELSGGMRQKVAVICALARMPQILVCDEPFSAIDFVSRLDLLNKFKLECGTLGLTCLFVTHNIEEAIFLGNRVIVMSRQPGKIRREFPVDLGPVSHDSVGCRQSPVFQSLFHEIWAELQRG